MTRLLPNTGYQYKYAVHKETDCSVESFCFIRKNYTDIDLVMSRLRDFPKPPQRKINRILHENPNVSAAISSFKSNHVKSYAKPEFVSYRRSLYLVHVYQFVNNDHCKIEISTPFDPKVRPKDSVTREMVQVLEKLTFGIPHVNCLKHSLED